MIKALVVDDSMVVREFLTNILNADPDIQVVGSVGDGEEALEAVKEQRPDVVTMDIRMPGMGGLEATRRIMETYPTPIVIVSGTVGDEEAASFRAVEAGALAVLQRPAGVGHSEHEETARELVRTVKLMSEVKVVKRWARGRAAGKTAVTPAAEVQLDRTPAEIRVVAIGASTGGPVALQQILSRLPANFPAPLLIVQHIAAGFVEGFAEWLAQSSVISVRLAAHGEPLLPGSAFVAPDGFHLGIGAGERIALSRSEPENGLRPSVSYLFRSVAHVCGRSAVGVLLTGMGRDGASELKLMKEKGAVTIAQDAESSVIHGMPGEAIKLHAATYVLSPGGIASALTRLAGKRS